MRTVYPRAYGGTLWGAILMADRSGLSPRVRGNRLATDGGPGCAGSIPARTGEPPPPAPAALVPPVYPRAYGGTVDPGRPRDRLVGLSPRVRGNLLEPCRQGREVGSIPARTGEPECGRHKRIQPTVYPRAYGGTSDPGFIVWSGCGLSPRVRGNPLPSQVFRFPLGSIPARTGEPPGSRYAPPPHAVYPRAYGGTPSANRYGT